jgi:drug/metabolite transporter (DMT)-like permease
MAMTAYASLSIGFVLMKKGIDWIGFKGKKTKIYFENISIWIIGFVIANIYGLPSAIALKSLPVHIVSSFAGFGIIVMVFFSRFLLKEKVFKSDFWFSLLIITGIILLNLFLNQDSRSPQNNWGLVLLFIWPLLLFFFGLFCRHSATVKTVIFASVSGFSAGLMVLFLAILVLNFQYRISSYLGSIYLYLYLFSALLSTVSLQFANKSGPMMLIGPVQYSCTIIYPVIASLLVFNSSINPIQYISIALIIFSVISIMKKR